MLDTKYMYLYMLRIRRIVYLIWTQVTKVKNQAIERRKKRREEKRFIFSNLYYIGSKIL